MQIFPDLLDGLKSAQKWDLAKLIRNIFSLLISFNDSIQPQLLCKLYKGKFILIFNILKKGLNEFINVLFYFFI